MPTPNPATSSIGSQALKFVPTLVAVLIVGVLFTVQPNGYKTMLLGLAVAYTVVVAIIMIWSAQKARARKTPNA